MMIYFKIKSMEIAVIFITFIVGFALGLYVTTQIGDWINKR